MLDVKGLHVMQIIGGDGLDKKSRIANERFIKSWYEAVPTLVQAYHAASTTGDMRAFHSILTGLPGLRGDLTRKEFFCCLAGSTHGDHCTFGARGLVFGPGAHNGAYVFLGVGYPSKGLGAQRYVENISPRLTEVKTAMNTIRIDDTELTLGDLETSLCTIVVYAKLVHSLRNNAKLRTPAGFRPYIQGAIDPAALPDIPVLEYDVFRLEGLATRWESRVLRKRPAGSITPQLLSVVTVAGVAKPTSKATRGCDGARSSTSQPVAVKDAKHPHECRICHKYVGSRCKVHCGQPVIYCSGQMAPSRVR
jgi:hypothetical protein